MGVETGEEPQPLIHSQENDRGKVEEVRHEADLPAEQPPLDAPDGTHRRCPQHRVIPAAGPCTPCGLHRLAYDRAEAAMEAELTEQMRRAVEEDRAHRRQQRALADAELDGCGLCDDDGTATVTTEHGTETTVCLHDAARNRNAVSIRQDAREAMRALTRRPATYGARG